MLKLIDVTKQYNDFLAVDHLNFTLNPGEILGLVGQNGAGKSTTFKMILNFIKPTSGEIFIDGRAFSEDLLKYIGFLP
ncbi:ATP-binding cassette domain-containing protein, partial [Campylobacter jejuni]|nr:ATP-binding cassette domain-containing protein [Campylobacter jejuni]